MESFYVLQDAISFMEDHLCEVTTPQQIAAYCHYSVSNLKYLFQKVFQYGMMDYMTRRRMTEAAKELVTTNQNICEIAIKYGYHSQEVFSRSFQKIWMETPTHFRKHHMFYSLFPRQEFYCDECGVFRRNFDLSDLRKYVSGQPFYMAVCFDIIGIRSIKTNYGRNAGEQAVLCGLQRIERYVQRESCHACTVQGVPGGLKVSNPSKGLFRIAGDKFVLIMERSEQEKAAALIKNILAHNGELIEFPEMTTNIAMFAGVTVITKEMAESVYLFRYLDQALTNARIHVHRYAEHSRCGSRCQIDDMADGFWQMSVTSVVPETSDGISGFGAQVIGEQIRFCFDLEGEAVPITWSVKENSYRLFFPIARNWYRKQYLNEEKGMVREHICVIRNMRISSERILFCEKLYLEYVKKADGKIICLNEGGLREAVFEGRVSKEEHRLIKETGKEIRAYLSGH